MTRDQCKDLLVEKIASLGGVRADEFVAWSLLYTIQGFSEVFHPEILKQLLSERRITTIEYSLPGSEMVYTFLLPVDTTIKVFNGKASS
jgi:hypothetical protein